VTDSGLENMQSFNHMTLIRKQRSYSLLVQGALLETN